MTACRSLYLVVSALALAACAGKTPPFEPAYDSAAFAPADRAPAPVRPVEIVTVPEPLPLPGQLKPLPKPGSAKGDAGNAAPEAASPEERAKAATTAARVEPARAGYVNAVQVYPFTPGALYRLYAAPGQVSDIALEPGERLIAVSAGDTVRWVVGDTTSGAGASEQVHVLVKPVAADLVTNLVITTDRRAYHLELESTEATYMAAVSWRYPHGELLSLRRKNAHAEAHAAETVDAGLALERLRFRYRITGDSPPWRPLRAFDDGDKVYLEFPRRLARGEAPPLFVMGAGGSADLVNYRVRGRYYIVDRLFAAAELRLGTDPQRIVRITRTDSAEAGQ